MTIQELLDLCIKNRGSDLHLMVNIPPTIRQDGMLRPLTNYPALTPQDMDGMIYGLLTPEQKRVAYGQ